MSYEHHDENMCDRCDKKVGKNNLFNLPFIYKDMNDVAHKDLGLVHGIQYEGYRQYYVCKDCMNIMNKNKQN